MLFCNDSKLCVCEGGVVQCNEFQLTTSKLQGKGGTHLRKSYVDFAEGGMCNHFFVTQQMLVHLLASLALWQICYGYTEEYMEINCLF